MIPGINGTQWQCKKFDEDGTPGSSNRVGRGGPQVLDAILWKLLEPGTQELFLLVRAR